MKVRLAVLQHRGDAVHVGPVRRESEAGRGERARFAFSIVGGGDQRTEACPVSSEIERVYRRLERVLDLLLGDGLSLNSVFLQVGEFADPHDGGLASCELLLPGVGNLADRIDQPAGA